MPAYHRTAGKEGIGQYLRDSLTVTPEDVIADARAAGLDIRAIEDFRGEARDSRRIDRLASKYVGQTARWCALTGAVAGVGGLFTALVLSAGDFLHLAARLYRLSLQLGVLHGLDPLEPSQRERIEEIYLSALGVDVTRQAMVRRILGRKAQDAGSWVTSLTYKVRFVTAVVGALWSALLWKLLGRLIPLVGSIVGAYGNYRFVSKASRRMREMLRRELQNTAQPGAGAL